MKTSKAARKWQAWAATGKSPNATLADPAAPKYLIRLDVPRHGLGRKVTLVAQTR